MQNANTLIRSNQKSLNVIKDGKLLAKLTRNANDQFQCPAPCFLQMHWAGSMQKHCKSCPHFLQTFSTANEQPESLVDPIIAPLETITLAEESAPKQTNILNIPNQMCTEIFIAGERQPFKHNETYNALICNVCNFIVGNVHALEFHFRKHHKQSSVSRNFGQIKNWIIANHPMLQDQKHRQTLMLPILSGTTSGISGIPLLYGLQCFLCEFATISDGSMKNHLALMHASTTPYARRKLQVKRVFVQNPIRAGKIYAIQGIAQSHSIQNSVSSEISAESYYKSLSQRLLVQEEQNCEDLNLQISRSLFFESSRINDILQGIPIPEAALVCVASNDSNQSFLLGILGASERLLFSHIIPAQQRSSQQMLRAINQLDIHDGNNRRVDSYFKPLQNLETSGVKYASTYSMLIIMLLKLNSAVLLPDWAARFHDLISIILRPKLNDLEAVLKRRDDLLLELDALDSADEAWQEKSLVLNSHIDIVVKCLYIVTIALLDEKHSLSLPNEQLPAFVFYAFLSCSASGRLNDCSFLSSKNAHIQYFSKGCKLMELHRLGPLPHLILLEAEKSLLDSFQSKIPSFFNDTAMFAKLISPFCGAVVTQQIQWKSIAKNEIIIGNGSISLIDIGINGEKMRARAIILIQELLDGFETSAFEIKFTSKLVDQLSNMEPGYSAFTDSSNNFGNAWLKLLDYLITKKSFATRLSIDEPDFIKAHNFHRRKIQDWNQRLQELESLIFVLFVLTSGQPARSTELSAIRLRNSMHGPRNVFIQFGRIVIVSNYNKTNSTTQFDSFIVRSIPVWLSDLFLKTIVLFRPIALVLDNQATIMEPEVDKRNIHTSLNHLFVRKQMPASADDLKSVWVRIIREYFQVHISWSLMRHIQIAFTRAHLDNDRQSTEQDELASFRAQSAGHSLATDRNVYGRELGSQMLITSDKIEKGVLASMRQQILYNLADDLSCIIVKDNGAQQADWKAPTTPTADLQITLQSIDSKQQTILDSVAESLNYAPSSSKDLICQQQSYSQIEKVTMQLYRIFGKASFKSRSQRKLAVRLAQPSSVRNPGAILAILKTGAEKTAAYVIASSICNNLITFVIVPTIALLSQMLNQLTELQLSCHLWKKDDIERHTNFQLLSMESAVSSEFLNYAGNLAGQGKVYRMIIDEAHTPLVWNLLGTFLLFASTLIQKSLNKFLKCGEMKGRLLMTLLLPISAWLSNPTNHSTDLCSDLEHQISFVLMLHRHHRVSC